MSSVEDARRGLADDVASLTRVRNRFSRSSDQQLYKIMPVLLPKLFKRLEKYRTLVMNDDEVSTKQSSLCDSTISLIEEAKKNVYGIVANAMERLRGNESMPSEPLIRAMMPFINSSNPVVGTWALAFLQISIRRIPLTNVSLTHETHKSEDKVLSTTSKPWCIMFLLALLEVRRGSTALTIARPWD